MGFVGGWFEFKSGYFFSVLGMGFLIEAIAEINMP
jgi:hypothetical protein